MIDTSKVIEIRERYWDYYSTYISTSLRSEEYECKKEMTRLEKELNEMGIKERVLIIPESSFQQWLKEQEKAP